MNVSYTWLAARKDLLRHVRDPMALLLWLMIPLGVGTGIALATGGSAGPKPTAQLLLVDEDKSLVSRLLRGAMNQSGDMIRSEEVSYEEGWTRISSGDGSALLVIPRGFGDAVLNETPTTLRLVTNPEQSILPNIIRETLDVLRDGIFYLHRVLGKELRELAAMNSSAAGTVPDAEVAGFSVAVNQAVARVDKYLFPPVIELETVSVKPEEPQPVSFALLFLPGVVVMSLLFTALGISEDVWRERAHGTLARAASAPRGVLPLLTGKLLAAACVNAAISFLILALGMAYLSVPLSRLPLALVWATFSGCVFLVLMILIQLFASSQRTGSILANTIVFPLLMLGESMFPSETMPRWMAVIGRWTPNGWALERLKDILLGRLEPVSMATAFAVLFIFGSLAFAAGAGRLARFSSES